MTTTKANAHKAVADPSLAGCDDSRIEEGTTTPNTVNREEVVVTPMEAKVENDIRNHYDDNDCNQRCRSGEGNDAAVDGACQAADETDENGSKQNDHKLIFEQKEARQGEEGERTATAEAASEETKAHNDNNRTVKMITRIENKRDHQEDNNDDRQADTSLWCTEKVVTSNSLDIEQGMDINQDNSEKDLVYIVPAEAVVVGMEEGTSYADGKPEVPPEAPSTQQPFWSELFPDSEQSWWWESLPEATPVFEVEVQVWNFDEPVFTEHFSLGFYGNDPVTASDAGPSTTSRDPMFTEQDLSNPFRCIGKTLGIICFLPLYLVYLVFWKCAWLVPFLRFLDRILVRPFGWVLDILWYISVYLSWGIYGMVLVPPYVCVVYCLRGLRNMGLWLAKCFLLVAEYPWRYLIFPVFSAVKLALWLVYSRTAPCFWSVMKYVYNKLMLPCALFVRTVVVWVGRQIDRFRSWLRRVLQRIYDRISLMAKWIREKILVPFYQGFMSGLRYAYRHIVLPVGRCIDRYLIRPIVQVARSFYNFVLAPLGRFVRDAFQSLRNFGISISRTFH